MSAAPVPEADDLPLPVLAAIRAELQDGEQLVWAGRPWLKCFFKKLLLSYPICLVGAAATAALGWYFYSWAEQAGALTDFKILLCFALIGFFVLGLVVVPLLWPIRLRRSWYALTTRRVVLCAPRLLILWPRVRSVDASRVAEMQVTVWAFLPDGTGDIMWGWPMTAGAGGRLRRNPRWVGRMELVPRAEQVAELIRQTLAASPDGGGPAAVPSTE